MAEAKIDFIIDGARSATTLGELKQGAEDLNTALEGARIGSDEYKKLNQELVTTTKKVKNLELGFEALDSEGVASEIGSVAGAIGDVATGLVLVSGGNKSLEEMAANIEMALGVSMALKGGIEGVQSAIKLRNDAIGNGNKIMLKAIALQKAFGAASASVQVGIIAVVTAIVAVVVALKRWASQTTATEAAQEKLNEATLAGAEAAGKEEAKIKVLTTALLGATKGTQARVDALKALNDVIPDSIGFITEETIATGEAINVIRDYINIVKERAELAALEDMLTEAIGKRLRMETQIKMEGGEANGIVKEAMAAQKEYENVILSQVNALQQNLNSIEGNNDALVKGTTPLKERSNHVKESTDAIKENTEAEVENTEAINDKERVLNEIIELENKHQDKLLDAQEREKNAVRDKYFTLIEEAKNYGFETNMLEEARLLELQEITDQYEEIRLEKLKQTKQEEADANQKLKDQLKVQEEEWQRLVSDAKDKTIAAATSLLSSIEDINTLAHKRDIDRIKEKQKNGEKLTASEQKRLKKQEAIEKAFALAKIAIDTAVAVAGAISSGASQPYPLNLVAIATGVAAVLAGVASAYKALGGGSQPAGVSAPTIENSSSEQEDSSNAPVINEFETGSSLLNAPQQVVVVEDINNGQNSVAAIEATATYG